MSRARKSASNIELPAADELRDRILDAVEQAIDRVGEVVEDAPSASDAAKSVRKRTRNMEIASAAFIAGAPALARAARDQVASRRSSRSALAMVPVTVVSRPLLIGTGVVGGIVASALVIRAIRKRRAAPSTHKPELNNFDPTRFDVDEVDRMQDEGGNPAGSSSPQARRFVRSGS